MFSIYLTFLFVFSNNVSYIYLRVGILKKMFVRIANREFPDQKQSDWGLHRLEHLPSKFLLFFCHM